MSQHKQLVFGCDHNGCTRTQSMPLTDETESLVMLIQTFGWYVGVPKGTEFRRRHYCPTHKEAHQR